MRSPLDDYREFFEFDIEILREDPLTKAPKVVGHLSKRLGPGSGGEHRAPLYVIAGAALASAYRLDRGNKDGLRLMLLDGAIRFGRQAEQLWNNADQRLECDHLLTRVIDVLEADGRRRLALFERTKRARDRRLDEIRDHLLVVGPRDVFLDGDRFAGLVDEDVLLREREHLRRREGLLDLLRQMHQPREALPLRSRAIDQVGTGRPEAGLRQNRGSTERHRGLRQR